MIDGNVEAQPCSNSTDQLWLLPGFAAFRDDGAGQQSPPSEEPPREIPPREVPPIGGPLR